jgi:hypothetical protein
MKGCGSKADTLPLIGACGLTLAWLRPQAIPWGVRSWDDLTSATPTNPRKMKSIALPSTGKSKLAVWTAVAFATVIVASILLTTNVFAPAWEYMSGGKRRELPIRVP